MLPYHRDRLLQTAEHFAWKDAVSKIQGDDGLLYVLKALEGNVDVQSTTPLRIRIVLYHDGKIAVETSPTLPVPLENLFPLRIPPPQSSFSSVKVSPLTGGVLTMGPGDSIPGEPRKGEAWSVVADMGKTSPSSFTNYKTTRRSMYSESRKRAGIENLAETKEVLMISDKDDAIMEGSITTVFFWRNGKWVTPPTSSGGQIGVVRRWLLEKGLCVEEVVKVDSLVDGEEIWISNAVRGLVWGKVKL
ncbi:hypothetical protein B7463_g5371, partial [Scytalidium lignicola]